MANFSPNEVSAEKRAALYRMWCDRGVVFAKWHLTKNSDRHRRNQRRRRRTLVNHTHALNKILSYGVMKIISISLLRTSNEMREQGSTVQQFFERKSHGISRVRRSCTKTSRFLPLNLWHAYYCSAGHQVEWTNWSDSLMELFKWKRDLRLVRKMCVSHNH